LKILDRMVVLAEVKVLPAAHVVQMGVLRHALERLGEIGGRFLVLAEAELRVPMVTVGFGMI
jgi:hypothetical protein